MPKTGNVRYDRGAISEGECKRNVGRENVSKGISEGNVRAVRAPQ